MKTIFENSGVLSCNANLKMKKIDVENLFSLIYKMNVK